MKQYHIDESILPTEKQVTDLLGDASIIAKTADKIIASGDMESICQYYSEGSCSLALCNHKKRTQDGHCISHGIINDVIKDKKDRHYADYLGRS